MENLILLRKTLDSKFIERKIYIVYFLLINYNYNEKLKFAENKAS